jgi:O-antigen/teichoic acid export membrane protein
VAPAPRRPSALRIGGWVVAGRIAPQASGLLLLVMGGRHLAPETLGSFVLAFAGVEVLRTLVRAGWREAAVLDADGRATPALLSLAVASGLAVQPLTLAAAVLAPRFLATPDLGPALLLLGVAILPVGAVAVWEGALLRADAPDRAARPLIAAEIVQSAAASLLLAADWGILALATARALRAAVLAPGLAAAAGWPCALSRDLAPARELLPVSRHVTLANLANLAGSSGADLVVGLVLGPAAVALYRVAARIAGAVAEVVTETTRIFAWTALAARGPLDTAAVAALFDRAFLLTAPVFLGLALAAPHLLALVLGPAWAGAAPVLAILALARLAAVPVTVAAPVLASHGRTRALPRLATALTLASLVGTLAAGRFGVAAVALAQLAAAAIGAAATFALLRPITPLARILPDATSLAGALALALAVAAAGAGPAPLLLQIVAGAATWAAFLRLARPALAADLLGSLRRPER